MKRRTALSFGAAVLLAPPGRAQPAVPRSRTLIFAQNFDPQSLWPNFGVATDNVNAGAMITEPLFRANPRTDRIEPLLASSLDRESSTAVVVGVRNGVRFTNGEMLDADAVVSAVNVFRDPKQTPAYGNFGREIAAVEKLGDDHVRIALRRPSPAVNLLLTQVFITPPKYWASVGSAGFGQRPIGTGPFMFTSWLKDDQLVLDRNPGYWGSAPQNIDRVVIRPVPDDTARAAGLQAGEYDVTSALSITDVAQLETEPGISIVAVPSARIFVVLLSTLDRDPGPMHDKRVRQALNYAVDKEGIIKDILFGRAKPLHGQVLRSDQPGFDPSLTDYPYDPAKARTLLKEAGFPNGFELEFKFPSGRYAQDREVSEAIAGMFQAVGLRLKMTSLEPGEFLRQMVNRQLGAASFGGYAPGDDPDLQVVQYRSDFRYSYVQSPAFDALIDAGAQELDPARRADIYQQLMRLMHEEAPAVFLFEGIDNYGVSKRVKGLQPTRDQRITLYGVSLTA